MVGERLQELVLVQDHNEHAVVYAAWPCLHPVFEKQTLLLLAA
jgi:hypothetical protein